MNCPVCDDRMREVNRNGVDIDICPSCKGVWLDRGELEKLLEIAASMETGTERPHDVRESIYREREHEMNNRHESDERYRGESDHHRDHDRYKDGHGTEYGRGKRRGSWLSDILEGFGGGDD